MFRPKPIVLVVLTTIALFFAADARANEGTAYLKPEGGKAGECFVSSIFVEGSYKVMASCRNLPVAWSAEKNRYVLWRTSGEKVSRIGEIIAGKLYNNINDKFERLLVTAESDGYTNKPSEDVVARGELEALAFGSSSTGKSFYTPAPTTTAKGSDILVPQPTGTSKLTSAVVGVAKVVILGFVLLLVVVGVLGFLARKRGL